jgi:hypothetical protein
LEDLQLSIGLSTEDCVVVQLQEAIDYSRRLDILDSLVCVDLVDVEVVLGAASVELQPVHYEREDGVAVSHEGALLAEVFLLEHIDIVLDAIHEDQVLVSQH